MLDSEVGIVSKPGVLHILLLIRETRPFVPERNSYDFFPLHIWQSLQHLSRSPKELLGVLSPEVLDWLFCPSVTEFSVFPCTPLVLKQTMKSELTGKATVFS